MKLIEDGLDWARKLGMRREVERLVALRLGEQQLADIDVLTSIDAVAKSVDVTRPDLSRAAAPDGTVTIMFSDIEDLPFPSVVAINGFALGGGFVRRMHDVGWCSDDHRLAMNESVRRTMFKLEWDALLNVDRAGFPPSLDEERELFAFYLRHPHAPEGTRKRIDEARAVAPTGKACASLDEAETIAAEEWRLEKVRRIAEMDPTYPAAYAVGVARYRHKDYEASVQSLREWLLTHPDGPWTLRARNHLRAALARTALD